MATKARKPRISRSAIFAGVLVLALLAWFALGSRDTGGDIYADVEARETATSALPTVVVRDVRAEERPLEIETYGRTRAHRRVEIKARTAASVAATPIKEGTVVAPGTVICRQDVDAREAQLSQAKAQLAKAEADLRATERLVAEGFRAETSLVRDQAASDSARAQVAQAENELDNIVMRAPFRGVFDMQMAEVGDYLSPGQPCGLLLELDPLVVEAELSETQVGSIDIGQPVSIQLATGERVEGVVTFLESEANSATRTFRMEAELPNPDLNMRAGVSATVELGVGSRLASRVPAGVLTLGEDGETGVRFVDGGNRVRFARVEVLDETPEGMFVTGLPDSARVIVEGQDFVAEGAEVEPVRESSRASGAPLAARGN